MGESIKGESDLGAVTLRAAQGIGVKYEQLTFTALSPPFPGYTLLNHVHAGASYRKLVDVNVHYIVSWAQDARVTTALGGNGGVPDGSIDVSGAEARAT